MTERPMRRLAPVWLLTILLTILLAACASEPVGPSGSPLVVEPPVATPAASQGVVPVAGKPYSAADILAAMQASTRPGGVPDRLETAAVASAVADQVRTWDGEPWQTMSVGAACGPRECTLELAGSSPGTAGTDLYSFVVDPAMDFVLPDAINLHGYPAALDPVLDQMARGAAAGAIGDLTYVSARWLPLPQRARYWLAYRSGGEEGASGLDLLLDATSGKVLRRHRF